MMFRLVRVDVGPCPPIESCFTLAPGVHPFGRGVFLDCDDKRVSRRHGKLEVADNMVTLTALHTNPCFLVKSSAPGTQILKSGSSEVLTCGDKFGLLPNSHWYELKEVDSVKEGPVSSQTTETYSNGVAANEEEEIDCPSKEEIQADQPEIAASASLLGQNCETANNSQLINADENILNIPDEPGEPIEAAPGSPSLLDRDLVSSGEGASVTAAPTPSKRPQIQDTTLVSPYKRARASDSEQEDVKPSTSALSSAMAAPQSSTSDSGAGDVAVKKEVKDEPASPPPRPAVPLAAVPPGRERCMYGAQCYRRNPQHKLAFSHPSDADWGPGERGVCPWGAGCTRSDRRHWRDHTHPPGTAPAAAAGPNRGPPTVVVRHGTTFYINAHSVHFHDDHYSVEDSDGESVDYDYEF